MKNRMSRLVLVLEILAIAILHTWKIRNSGKTEINRALTQASAPKNSEQSSAHFALFK